MKLPATQMDSRQIPGGPSVPSTSNVSQPPSVPPPSIPPDSQTTQPPTGPPPSVPLPPPPIPPRTTTTNVNQNESSTVPPPNLPPRPPPPSPGLVDKSAGFKSEVTPNPEEKSKESLLAKEEPAESSKKPTPPQTLNPKQTKPAPPSAEATKIINEQIQKHYLFRDLIGKYEFHVHY